MSLPSSHLKSYAIGLLSLLMILGCSASFQLKHPRARSEPNIEPLPRAVVIADESARQAAATLPAGELNLLDAPPIDTVIRSTHAQQVEMQHMLQPVDGPAVYFGQVLASDPKRRTARTTPIIATRDSNRWKAIPIDDERAVDASWAYVGAGPERGHAWGVLEKPPDNDHSPAYLLLVHSNDSGATWRTIPLIKPSPSARYDSICMSRYRGRVSVYQPPGQRGARAGYYHYHTADDGASWSTPTFEPDALTPADPLSASEQIHLRQDPPSRAADAK